MIRYFLAFIFLSLLIPSAKLSAQLDQMTQEDMKRKAEEMGFSFEDYLKLQQSQIPQLPSKGLKKETEKKQSEDKPEIIPPVNKPMESYRVAAFAGREHADSLPAFGYNIFSGSPTAFQTSLNVPAPFNYIIGPGDEIVITMWGETQLQNTLTVNKEGNIYIPDVGMVNVNGLSLQGLRQKLFGILSKTYSSLDVSVNGTAKSSLDVSTGSLRTIKVYVLGEVSKPGGYALPSLSTSFTALYYSGGATLGGSLRNIKILRGGAVISIIDLYDYLTKGDRSKDVMLEDGDIVFIPPVGERVALAGEVFRPAIYELKPNDRLKDLLVYSGGLNFNAYFQRIHIERIIPFEQRDQYANNIMDIDFNFKSVDELKNSIYHLSDGDVIDILSINKKHENRVTVLGKVKKPGVYELTSNVMTIRDLIYKADSLSPEAFREKAILTRTLPTEKKEIINIDLNKALADESANNIVLKNRDKLEVFSIERFIPTRTVEISGAVRKPGLYKRFNNMTVTDLIISAGGLTDSATTKNIEITRMDTTTQTAYANKFLVSLPQKYWNNNRAAPFYLADYDRVLVKPDPLKTFNQTAVINGEVKFPGTYTILYEGEKIYDFIKRAGGFKYSAYTEGMYVYRQNPLFKNVQNDLLLDTLKRKLKDIPIYDRNVFNREYSNRIPILWEDILQDTSSIYNIPLQPGDSLIVPKDPNVVYVIGEIGIPSSVPYRKGGSLKYYIEQAGGYTESSAKGYEIVILPNGKKWKPSSWFFIPDPEILSGSTVIVPTIIESESQFWPIMRDVAAVVTSTAVLILTVNNLTK